jgi:hypothetical protein
MIDVFQNMAGGHIWAATMSTDALHCVESLDTIMAN